MRSKLSRKVRLRRCLLQTVVLIASISLSGALAEAADVTVHASDRFIIPVHGHQFRVRVDPEAPAYVAVNSAVARRIGLRPPLLGGRLCAGWASQHPWDYRIRHPVHDGPRARQRVASLDRDAFDDADGFISPAAPSYKRVNAWIGSGAAWGGRQQVPRQIFDRIRPAVPNRAG